MHLVGYLYEDYHETRPLQHKVVHRICINLTRILEHCNIPWFRLLQNLYVLREVIVYTAYVRDNPDCRYLKFSYSLILYQALLCAICH